MIDLGFVDRGRMCVQREQGTWLHAELRQVARGLVGIDFDADGVDLANTLGYQAYHADCQDAQSVLRFGISPAEVVVAGELIEHLDRPGAFLGAVKALMAPGGILVLTTPNCLSLTNFLAALIGRELVNPDHVAWLSPQTLTALLSRHGWHVRDIFFYPFTSVRDASAAGCVSPLHQRVFATYHALAHPLFKLRPWLADGIIVVPSAHTDCSAYSEGS